MASGHQICTALSCTEHLFILLFYFFLSFLGKMHTKGNVSEGIVWAGDEVGGYN